MRFYWFKLLSGCFRMGSRQSRERPILHGRPLRCEMDHRNIIVGNFKTPAAAVFAYKVLHLQAVLDMLKFCDDIRLRPRRSQKELCEGVSRERQTISLLQNK